MLILFPSINLNSPDGDYIMSASNNTLAAWLVQSLYASISKVQPGDGLISGKFTFSSETDYHTKRSKVFFTVLNVLLNRDINPSNVNEITDLNMEDLLLMVRTMKSSRDSSFSPRSIRSILDFSEKAIQDHIESPACPSFSNSVFASGPGFGIAFGDNRTFEIASSSSTSSSGPKRKRTK